MTTRSIFFLNCASFLYGKINHLHTTRYIIHLEAFSLAFDIIHHTRGICCLKGFYKGGGNQRVDLIN